MLHLPPGQGFSIYSLAALLPLLPAKQRPTRPQRLDVDRRRGRLPRSELPDAASASSRTGMRRFSHARDDRRAAARRREPMCRSTTVACGPATTISRVIRGGWQLAGGHGAVDRAAAVDDLVGLRRGRHHHLRLRRHLHRRRGADRRRSAPVCATARTPRRSPRCKVHTKCVPDLDAAAAACAAYVVRRRPSLKRLAVGAARSRAVPLVGLCRAGLRRSRAAGSTNCSARARSTASAAPISTRRARRAARRRASIWSRMQVQYSLLDDRPEHGLVDLCRKHGIHLLCYGTVAGGFLSDRWLGAPEPQPPFENRSLTKYKLIIDDFGGWDLFQELLRTLAPNRRPPRHRHRLGGEPRHARPAAGRRRHRRRPQSFAPRRQCWRSRRCTSRRRITRRSPRCSRGAQDPPATPSRSSATAPAAMARS